MPESQMYSLPTPSSDVSFYPFVDGGVLFLEGSRQIWALNSSSAFIWCLLDEVTSLDELASRLASTFNIGKDKALQDAGALLNVLEQEGLFAAEPFSESMESDRSWDITPTGPRLLEPNHWAVRRFFRVADHLFEFCCQDTALGDTFTHMMDHLAVDNCELPDTRLAVTDSKEIGDTWDIFLDDLGFMEGRPENEVLPNLATLIFVRCCETLKANLLFHAAVIEMDGITVMFPGEAGSGKTTLAAALMAHGCRFFSDELAVLNLSDLCVSPLPLPMSIKPGSVKPLESYYPGLADRPIHLRTDGKKVRYLSPSVKNLPEVVENSSPVDFLIFPKYIKGAEDRLAKIDKMEALQRLAKTGSSNRVFTSRDVEAMITLIERRPCYELVFSELPQAVSILKKHIFQC
ncbi:MAG: PqqD family peptide modification chaperone [Deltaproteobacteria bacterium]|nr:PqqD family peptide modification chaperone [Deltaproteobacteria bacterium]